MRTVAFLWVQANNLLAQHLLGHCMLRELRAAGQGAADSAAASASRLAAAQKLAGKLRLGKLAGAAVQVGTQCRFW